MRGTPDVGGYLMRRMAFLVVAVVGTALLATPQARATVTDKVPGQFVAKLYTEGLGRAPDPAGWSVFLGGIRAAGCSRESLAQAARTIYTSGEFDMQYPANEYAARVLTLYRGVLNRNAEQQGLDGWAAGLSAHAITWPQVVDAFVAGPEFDGLANSICTSPATTNYFGPVGPPTLPLSGEGFPDDPAIDLNDPEQVTTALQRQLRDTARQGGGTVLLKQKVVLRLNRTLTVPSGVTLMTSGAPTPRSYALQARLERWGLFNSEVIRVDPGARLTNVWVDGQVLRPQPQLQRPGMTNIEVEGGNGTEVSGTKVENSFGFSNIQVIGSGEGVPCQNALIASNLVTAYSSSHQPLPGPYPDGEPVFADGITVSCEHATVVNNQVVDATDVGIIVFHAGGANQRSQVYGNTVLSAGNPGYGAYVAETGSHAAGEGIATHGFLGTSFHDNTYWTSPNTHVDFGLAVGTRAWWGDLVDLGTGAEFRRNGMAGNTAVVSTGIVVMGMQNATVQENGTSFVVVPANACPHEAIAYEFDPYAAGRNLQPGGVQRSFLFPGATRGCIGGHNPGY